MHCLLSARGSTGISLQMDLACKIGRTRQKKAGFRKGSRRVDNKLSLQPQSKRLRLSKNNERQIGNKILLEVKCGALQT